MYKMIRKSVTATQYQMDRKVFEKKQDAEKEYQIQLAKIQIAALQMEDREKAEFRKEVGLTLLENDAKILKDKVFEASVELAFCHEMGKTKFVIDEAALKVANTQMMYNSVCKKIFKICLKHGLKSEYLK